MEDAGELACCLEAGLWFIADLNLRAATEEKGCA